MKKVQKGWGYEIWIVNKPEYCGKLLHIDAGKKGSYHYHKLKDETFYVSNGYVRILYGFDDDINNAKERIMCDGESMHIPVGMRHQIIGLTEVDLFEFSTQHFDDDSYRVVIGDVIN